MIRNSSTFAVMSIVNELAIDAEEERDLYEHFSIKVDPGQEPVRIDKYLSLRIQNSTRTKIQAAVETGCVLVNKNPVKSNYKVKPHDEVSVVLPETPRNTEIIPEPMDLNIVYEDKDLLVINKPAGMVVHPGFNNYTGTLVHGLSYHFKNLPDLGREDRPGLVHRIDKDTSGLLVIAKNELTLVHLAKQFYDHSIERKYLALVWGDMKEENGTVDAHLMRDEKDRRRSVVTVEEDKGKHAITHFSVQERFYFTTLITCQLETGRTHQIRAHMKHIGHPLFNDAVYDGNRIIKGAVFSKFKQFIDNCFTLLNRQALHAYSLGFIHPRTGEKMHFEAPLPEDFSMLLEKIRKYSKANQM